MIREMERFRSLTVSAEEHGFVTDAAPPIDVITTQIISRYRFIDLKPILRRVRTSSSEDENI